MYTTSMERSKTPGQGFISNYNPRRTYLLLALVVVELVVLLGLVAFLLLRAGLFRPQPASPAPNANIAVNPISGQAGSVVTVTGYNWPPGMQVGITRLHAETGQGIYPPLATATVDDAGTFAVSFTLPTDLPSPGRITLQASLASGVGRAEASAYFHILAGPPATSTPTPEATELPPTPYPTVTPPPTDTPTPPPTATPEATALPPTPTPTVTPLAPTATPTGTPVPSPTPQITAWRGEYFANTDLSGTPLLTRNDPSVNFNWQAASPAPGLPADNFSARWTRSLYLPAGSYRFTALADDGVRVWLDDQLLIDEWHSATAETYVAERTLSAGTHTLRVAYYENWGDAQVQFWWEHSGEYPQWRGEYFSNSALTGAPALVRNDAHLDFEWGQQAPAAELPRDNFSVRWTRTLALEGGNYRFTLTVDDGARLYVNGNLLIDSWEEGSARTVTGDLALNKGLHTLRVEYFESGGEAEVALGWEQRTSYPDWKGEYWDNRGQQGNPLFTRNDVTLDFNWGTGAPSPRLPVDNFSARWTREVTLQAATYRFRLRMDDGARLWVDNRLVIDAWHDGPERELTADVPLAAGPHTLRVDYYEHTLNARVQLAWETLSDPYPDWKGEYWNNRSLSGSPVLVRNDGAIAFNWGQGSPAPGIAVNDFSARWSRTFTGPGTYQLRVRANDGVRVYVDGDRLLDEWGAGTADWLYEVMWTGGAGSHLIVVEYYEGSGDAMIDVDWQRIN